MTMNVLQQIRRDNLILLAGNHGGQSALAKALGRSKEQVNALCRSKPMGDALAKSIERALNLPDSWMDTTHPNKPVETTAQKKRRRAGAAIEPVPELTTKRKVDEMEIQQYDTGGSMGFGRLLLDVGPPGVIKSWRVEREWLRLNVQGYTSPDNLCIVTGFGPSMRPRFNPGDPLLVDRGVTTLESDGVYFFRVEDHGYIKQLQRIPTENGTVIRARSFNPDYEPFDITKKMDFEILGKVLTVWRSEQF